MTTRTIAGTNIHLEYCFLSGFEKHIVSIYINGEFYDHHEFDTFSEAESYMNDPFKAERRAFEREAARIAESDAMAERNASLIVCNRGRQIGLKRGSM